MCAVVLSPPLSSLKPQHDHAPSRPRRMTSMSLFEYCVLKRSTGKQAPRKCGSVCADVCAWARAWKHVYETCVRKHLHETYRVRQRSRRPHWQPDSSAQCVRLNLSMAFPSITIPCIMHSTIACCATISLVTHFPPPGHRGRVCPRIGQALVRPH